MFSLQMPAIFRAIMDDQKLLRVIMQLLNSACQRPFAHVLLQFLVENQMPLLARPESKVRGAHGLHTYDGDCT